MKDGVGFVFTVLETAFVETIKCQHSLEEIEGNWRGTRRRGGLPHCH